jgi:hypothetical protein
MGLVLLKLLWPKELILRSKFIREFDVSGRPTQRLLQAAQSLDKVTQYVLSHLKMKIE